MLISNNDKRNEGKLVVD